MTFVAILMTSFFATTSLAAQYNWLGNWRATNTKCVQNIFDSFEGDWISFQDGKNISLRKTDPRWGQGIDIVFPDYNGKEMQVRYEVPTETTPPDSEIMERTKDRFFYHWIRLGENRERYVSIQMIDRRRARAEFREIDIAFSGRRVNMRCTHEFIRR